MPPSPRNFAPLDFAQLIAVAVIWGANNVAAMIAVTAFPPMMVAAIRFTIVLAALATLLKPLPRESVKPMALMLLLVGPLHFGVQYIGLAMAHDLAPMVVAMQLWAPSSVLFAGLVLNERIGPLRLAGVAIAFAGVVAMTFDPVVFAQGGALFLVAAAAASYGLGAVLVRKIGAGVGPWTMQAWIALATAPSMGLASLLFERGQIEAARAASWLPWACLLYGAVISAIIANGLMFKLVQKYEVSRTTPYMLMTPLISFSLGALILGDVITARILIGGAITLAGVMVMALSERRFRAPS